MPFCSGCAGVLRSPVHARQAPRGAACSSGRATTPWPARSADVSEQVQTSECTLKLWSESRSSCATHLPHVPEIRSPTCALAWPRVLLVLFVTFSSGTCRDWLVLGTRAAPGQRLGRSRCSPRREAQSTSLSHPEAWCGGRPARQRTSLFRGAPDCSTCESLRGRPQSQFSIRAAASGRSPRVGIKRREEGGERARCMQRV